MLTALSVLLSWFTRFPGISKQAFSQLLYMLHNIILPSGNLLPASYDAAYAVIKPYLISVKEYHCCPNDCILYRGPNADKTSCPICGEDRYVNGGCVPKKRFKYIPLASRMKRYFETATTSRLLQGHSASITSTTTEIHDIHHTKTWKKWYSPGGLFGGDVRGLSLGLCLDGTNPYAKEKNSYSMWPMLVSILNLPPLLRRSTEFLQLVGIIPGKQEPKNTNTYLQVLVDELKELNGTQIYDGHQKNWFNVQAELLLHVMDYPGQNKVFHMYGKLKIYRNTTLNIALCDCILNFKQFCCRCWSVFWMLLLYNKGRVLLISQKDGLPTT